MADQKISSLTELTAPDALDELIIVDKSDTSMAATGTDKRILTSTLSEPAFSSYKILNIGSYVANSAVTAGTYAVHYTASAGAVAFSANSGATAMYLDPANFAAASRTTKYRLLCSAVTNATAPAITYTFGLYPVTAAGGGVGVVALTAGTVTSGSTVVFTTPGTTSLNTANSGDFTAPAAGYYSLGVVTSGTQATNATVHFSVQLQMRQV